MKFIVVSFQLAAIVWISVANWGPKNWSDYFLDHPVSATIVITIIMFIVLLLIAILTPVPKKQKS